MTGRPSKCRRIIISAPLLAAGLACKKVSIKSEGGMALAIQNHGNK